METGTTTSRDTISSFLQKAATPGLVLLTAQSQVAANAAGKVAATCGIPADTSLFVPSGDRYKVEDLKPVELFSSLTPEERNLLVFLDGDAMPSSLWSRLLRTLEEPGAPTLFVVALQRDVELPAPMRGRVTGELAVKLDPPELPPEILELCAPHWELAEELKLPKHYPELSLVLNCRTAADIKQAAAALPVVAPTPPARRDVLRLLLSRRVQEVDPLHPDALDQLYALRRAAGMLARHASPASVLAAAVTPLASFSSPHRPRRERWEFQGSDRW